MGSEINRRDALKRAMAIGLLAVAGDFTAERVCQFRQR